MAKDQPVAASHPLLAQPRSTMLPTPLSTATRARMGQRTVRPNPYPTIVKRQSVTIIIRLALLVRAGAGINPNTSGMKFLKIVRTIKAAGLGMEY
jgi:hypothetical protein